MNRRHFLYSGSSAAALALLPPTMHAQGSAATASLVVHSESQGKPIPPGFLGLSHEAAQLAHPDFFSPENKDLIGLFRRLGSRGVLRIGGSSSEYTVWSPDGAPLVSADTTNAGPTNAGRDRRSRHKPTPITPLAIENLAAFLDATDWDLIYGLNFGKGTAEVAAEQAAFVAKRIGSRLIAFQIGNEPDLYSHQGLRPPDWGYLDFVKQWTGWAEIIRTRVPGVHLGGPDDAHNQWVEPFAGQEGVDLEFLTSHYYSEGPPTDPKMNIDFLLEPRAGLQDKFQHWVQAARAHANIPFRLTECNSCDHGGKSGVSNVFASALWGADFMFLLAQLGVNGVNFHGGGASNYTPIASSNNGCEARPLYYAMLLFSFFNDSSLLPVTLDSGGANLTGYAARNKQNKLQVAVINKDLERRATVTIRSDYAHGKGRVLFLSAPSVESTTGVTLGGSEVAADGNWKPTQSKAIHMTQKRIQIDLPVASAALILFD